MAEHIGISEVNLLHIYGVAKKCYQIAKEEGFDESFCRKMYMIGWCYNVGSEFTEVKEKQSNISAEMFRNLVNMSIILFGEMPDAMQKSYNAIHSAYNAIRQHGKYMDNMTDEWRILSIADMLIDNKGAEVEVTTRLDELKKIYGEYSDQYLTACNICFKLGLTADNLVSLTT